MRFLLLLAALAVAAPAQAATAPRLKETSFEQLAKPLPLPYDEQADASTAVAAARAKARIAHKLLLIDLGGNWCLDCRILAGTMALPDLKPFVDRHFQEVTVDIGRFDRNGQIAASYGFKDRLKGVPAVLIVDPRTNRLLNRDRVFALADAHSMTPQALADWLAQWTR